jgi:hypothetical protein
MGCGGTQSPDSIILCDRCNGEVHLTCIRPPLSEVPAGDWFCSLCVAEAPVTVAQAIEATRPRRHRSTRPATESAPAANAHPAAANAASAASAAAAAQQAATGFPWTDEEDKILIRAMSKPGFKWSDAPVLLPHRSEQACRSRFHGQIKIKHPYLVNPASLLGSNGADGGGGSAGGPQPGSLLAMLASSGSAAADASSSYFAASSLNPTAAGGLARARGMPGGPLPQDRKRTRGASNEPGLFESLIDSLDLTKPAAVCVVCGYGKAFVMCAHPGCDAAYHEFCLGDMGPAPGEAWICPRHICAVCHAQEPDDVPVDKCPSIFDLPKSCKLATGKPVAAATTATVRISRCAGCPLALCHAHLNVPIGANAVPVSRPPAMYFGCERCVGLQGSTGGEEPPVISLARFLDRALAELVVINARVAAPFVHAPPNEVVEPVGIDTWNALAKDLPTSLAEVQRRVRLLKYRDAMQLKDEVQRMADVLQTLYAPTHPLLAEAAGTLPHLVQEKLAKSSREILAAQGRVELQLQRPPWSVTAFAKDPDALQGLAPWEGYARKCFASFNQDWPGQVDVPLTGALSQVPAPRREAQDVFGAVVQALEAARLLPMYDEAPSDLLTPSRSEIENLFEDHSAKLRAALKSAAEIRMTVLRAFDVLDGDKDTVLTIGGGHYTAEVAAANRCLEVTLAQTRASLGLEKKARQGLEARLSALERKPAAGEGAAAASSS